MTYTTPAWRSIRSLVASVHGEYCMSHSCDCDAEVDAETDQLYRAVQEEVV